MIQHQKGIKIEFWCLVEDDIRQKHHPPVYLLHLPILLSTKQSSMVVPYKKLIMSKHIPFPE